MLTDHQRIVLETVKQICAERRAAHREPATALRIEIVHRVHKEHPEVVFIGATLNDLTYEHGLLREIPSINYPAYEPLAKDEGPNSR